MTNEKKYFLEVISLFCSNVPWILDSIFVHKLKVVEWDLRAHFVKAKKGQN